MSGIKVHLPKGDGPHILIYDIETAPSLVWVWSQWNTNVIATEQDWYMLCFAYKWYGDKRTHYVGIDQASDFEPDSTNDYEVVKALHELFDAADVTIAHNGDAFDKKKANARFLYHGMNPPSPYKTIDTKKEFKRYTRMYSNALNEIGRYLDLGSKVNHTGFDLWRRCMRGDKAAWKTMRSYNKQDVELLEAAYEKILPWIGSPGHGNNLNRNHWSAERVCPKCGSHDIIKRGQYRTQANTYQSYQCKDCGGYSRSTTTKDEDDGNLV